MMRSSKSWHGRRALALAALATAAGCASSSAALNISSRELVMAYDDAHATGTLAFPSETYESMVRFQLPEGQHKPLRLRLEPRSVAQSSKRRVPRQLKPSVSGSP